MINSDWQKAVWAVMTVTLWVILIPAGLAAEEINCDKAHSLVSMSTFEKNREKANAHLKEAVQICPGFIRPHELLGNHYRKSGNKDKAWKHFNWAAELGSYNYKLYYLMAKMALAEGRLNQAAAYIQKSLQIKPKYRKALDLDQRINQGTDQTGPSLEMIAPAAGGTRYAEYRQTSLTVRGKATDRSGITRVLVNEEMALLNSEGYFTRDVALQEGTNTIWIAAMDGAGNTTRREARVTVLPAIPEVMPPPASAPEPEAQIETAPPAVVSPDTDGPVLTISEPPQTRAITVTQKTSTLRVKGFATDPSGISRILINDSVAAVDAEGHFSLDVALVEGVNTIWVAAVDGAGNTTRQDVRVAVPPRVPEKPLPTAAPPDSETPSTAEQPVVTVADTDGPELDIIEPATTRAIAVTQKSDTLRVKGIARDPSGVSQVRINAEDAVLDSEGRFTIDVVLTEGANTITISATDSAGNITRRELAVTAPAKQPVAPSPAATPVVSMKPIYDKSIAVVIGINGYEKWPPLSFAVNDAMSVKKTLEKMGFDKVIVILDKDATQRRILTAVGFELPRMVGINDRVMIYFAGHGQTESLATGATQGYLIPVDGDVENYFATAISMETLRGLSARIPSKHILYVMDSCYSGLGFNEARGLSPSAEDYLKRLSGMRSVQMITAGSMDEQVIEAEGHGLFTAYLLKAFSGAADSDGNSVLTATELGAWLKPAVIDATNARQTPLYGRLEGEGDVLFPLTQPHQTH